MPSILLPMAMQEAPGTGIAEANMQSLTSRASQRLKKLMFNALSGYVFEGISCVRKEFQHMPAKRLIQTVHVCREPPG